MMAPLALAHAAMVDAPPTGSATATAAVRIERAARVTAETFDAEAPDTRVVVREEEGRLVRLHLIEFQ